ncbi:hypothetical protein QF037_002795 [Streptomyces canus]|nr:hypothetical protein [Streptomyces canus]
MQLTRDPVTLPLLRGQGPARAGGALGLQPVEHRVVRRDELGRFGGTGDIRAGAGPQQVSGGHGPAEPLERGEAHPQDQGVGDQQQGEADEDDQGLGLSDRRRHGDRAQQQRGSHDQAGGVEREDPPEQ